MKKLAGLDLHILIDLMNKSIDSAIRSHHFDEHQALILEFDLKPQDTRLGLLTKLLKGKWRPPSSYRIEDFSFLSRDLLRLLELTQLNPKSIRDLCEMAPRFANLAAPLQDALSTGIQKLTNLEMVRDLIFSEIQKQKLTLREVARQSNLTEMSLHNYRKTGNLRFENLCQLCKTLKIDLWIEPRLAR